MILGITGHKGILGKSIINYIKKYEKNRYTISLYKSDVLNLENFEKWIEKVDIILHLAAVTSINDVNKNKKYAEKVNYNSVKFLTKKLKSYNSRKKLIFISSSHVYSSSKKKISEVSRSITYLLWKIKTQIRKRDTKYLTST